MDVLADATVLVVEDEPDVAQLLVLNLELAGATVLVSTDGADALVQARRHRPDVVVLDVMLPVMDGWEVLRTLQEDDQLATIPVVMLTALSSEHDVIQGHLEGAVEYVTKPFDVEALVRVVRESMVEPSSEDLDRRRAQVRVLLTRLAELTSGRSRRVGVRLSALESPPVTREPETVSVGRSRVATLTDHQRQVAGHLGRGLSPSELARTLGMSRANAYAVRTRIARKLGVEPGEVGEAARQLGLTGE